MRKPYEIDGLSRYVLKRLGKGIRTELAFRVQNKKLKLGNFRGIYTALAPAETRRYDRVEYASMTVQPETNSMGGIG